MSISVHVNLTSLGGSWITSSCLLLVYPLHIYLINDTTTNQAHHLLQHIFRGTSISNTVHTRRRSVNISVSAAVDILWIFAILAASFGILNIFSHRALVPPLPQTPPGNLKWILQWCDTCTASEFSSVLGTRGYAIFRDGMEKTTFTIWPWGTPGQIASMERDTDVAKADVLPLWSPYCGENKWLLSYGSWLCQGICQTQALWLFMSSRVNSKALHCMY